MGVSDKNQHDMTVYNVMWRRIGTWRPVNYITTNLPTSEIKQERVRRNVVFTLTAECHVNKRRVRLTKFTIQIVYKILL